MKIAVSILFLALAWGSASAKELRESYDVINMLNQKEKHVEVRTLRTQEDKGEVWYEMTKDSFAGATAIRITEIRRRLSTETREAGSKTYLKEVLATHPMSMQPGQKDFGFIETRDVASDKVLATWPVFYVISKSANGLLRATFEIKIGDTQHLRVVKDYEMPETYPYPLYERFTMVQNGKVVADNVFARRTKKPLPQ